ncbi:MAG: hypothetical protein ABIU29_08455, partial [Chthoniobacterales bacterium]
LFSENYFGRLSLGEFIPVCALAKFARRKHSAPMHNPEDRSFLGHPRGLGYIGSANVFPVSLALYARVAPTALSATIIGIYYLAFFAA